jgi:hypothetical protein
MFEHRSIPQRLTDHDRRIAELERLVTVLTDRIAALEAPKKASTP